MLGNARYKLSGVFEQGKTRRALRVMRESTRVRVTQLVAAAGGFLHSGDDLASFQ